MLRSNRFCPLTCIYDEKLKTLQKISTIGKFFTKNPRRVFHGREIFIYQLKYSTPLLNNSCSLFPSTFFATLSVSLSV